MLKLDRLHLAPGLQLVPVTLADAAALATLVSTNQAHLKAYLPNVAALGHPAAAREHIEHGIAAAAEGAMYEWHIYAENVLCGAVRIRQIDLVHRMASIGYYLGSGHQGKGLATLSVRAAVAWCFEHLNMNRIELRCTSDNLASQSLAKRVGFVWEGMLRQAELLNGKFVDHFVYGLLREEFKASEELEKAA